MAQGQIQVKSGMGFFGKNGDTPQWSTTPVIPQVVSAGTPPAQQVSTQAAIAYHNIRIQELFTILEHYGLVTL